MTQSGQPEVGRIAWVDLTVPEAESLRDFYRHVVGWRPAPVDMGGYADFNMNSPGSGEPQAGICHARGVNADLPPCWMIYVTVADAEESARRCVEEGGEIVVAPRSFGGTAMYCVIRDPAGAIAALYSP